jgi:hypothetical protein
MKNMPTDAKGLEKKLENIPDALDICVGDYIRFSYPIGRVVTTRLGYVSAVKEGCFYMTAFDMRNIRGYRGLADRFEIGKVTGYTVLVRSPDRASHSGD